MWMVEFWMVTLQKVISLWNVEYCTDAPKGDVFDGIVVSHS